MYSWETDGKEAGKHTTVAAMKQTVLKPHNRGTRVPHIEGIFGSLLFSYFESTHDKTFFKKCTEWTNAKKSLFFFWCGGWLVVLPDQGLIMKIPA